MGLEKGIEHGKEHRKPYRGSKRFDATCRNHGRCSYCESNRNKHNIIREQAAATKLKESKFEEDFIYMTQHEVDTLLQQAVDTWGTDSQLGMMQEECAELIQAISKYERHGTYPEYENLCEEIADVELMIEQMRYIFGDAAVKLIAQIREKKLLRLKDRLSPVTIIHKK